MDPEKRSQLRSSLKQEHASTLVHDVDKEEPHRHSGDAQTLCDAAEAGHCDVVERLLLLSRQDISSQGTLTAPRFDDQGSAEARGRALFLAAGAGHRDVVEVLLQHGARPGMLGDSGAIGIAAGNGHRDVVELLVQHTAAAAEGDDPDRSPGISFPEISQGSIVDRLMKHGTKEDYSESPTGNMTLVSAAHHGDEEIVQLLLDHGADVKAIIPPNENNALASAVMAGQIPTIQLLLQRGADPNVKVSRTTSALGWGCSCRQIDVVELLFQYGADANSSYGGRVDDGKHIRSVLGTAAANGYLDIVQLLLRNGASVRKDTVEWARRNGHREVADLLRSHLCEEASSTMWWPFSWLWRIHVTGQINGIDGNAV